MDSEGNLVGYESFDRLVRRILEERRTLDISRRKSPEEGTVMAVELAESLVVDLPPWSESPSYGEVDPVRPAVILSRPMSRP